MPTDTFAITSNGDDGSGFYSKAGAWPPETGGSWTNQGGNSMFVFKNQVGVSASCENDNCFVRFDTSTIPAGSTITAATLKLWVISKTDTAGFDVVADFYDFGGEPTVAGDYINAASPSIWTAVDIGAITVGAVNDFVLTDLTGIMRSGDVNGQGNAGITGIRLTLTAGAPASNTESSSEFATFDHATLQEPRLEVTYDLPPASSASLAWVKA